VKQVSCQDCFTGLFHAWRSLLACYSVLHCVAASCSVSQCVAVCCSVLQCVAVCCSVLQCVAVCCGIAGGLSCVYLGLLCLMM